MYNFFLVMYWVSLFLIFWAMVGYPISLKILKKLFPNKKINKDFSNTPTVTVVFAAYNEEKVIEQKLRNLLEIDYPIDRIKFIIASDKSTDRTNSIVQDFIDNHLEYDIKLYEVERRMGKTNAINEAHKLIDTEFMVVTDANAMLSANSIKELMAAYTDDNIGYVCGKLVYTNDEKSVVSKAESNYWNLDLEMRSIEGSFQTITAGNGALYSCRTNEYKYFNPMYSHDIVLPNHFSMNKQRSIMNKDALAYEKAGEVVDDEFGRRIRMNRNILKRIIPDFRILNIFDYKWYTYFYLGHRTSRYLLWLSHLVLLVSNIIIFKLNHFYFITFLGQMLFYLTSMLQIRLKTENKLLIMSSHYLMAIVAQWIGVFNITIGKVKPTWEKAESTR